MKKTMFDFDSKQEVREAFKAGNQARKKESVQDAVESVDDMQAQINLFKKQTGIELEIKDGCPYYDRNLYLDDCTEPTSLSSLPNGLKVEGDLYLQGFTGLTGLPAGLEVGGDLDLTGCTGLTSLPDGLKVEGCLWLTDCTGLTSLPDGLKVGGDLFLRGCTGLTSLPSDLVVQGKWIVHKGLLIPFFNKLRIPIDIDRDTRALYWREWQKTNGYLKEAFRAGNRARKKESVQDAVESVDSIQKQIDRFREQTGKELEIKDGRPYFDGDLDLGGCTGLTSLPTGLVVNKDMYLRGCTGLTSLPDGLKVGGYLNLDGCTGLTSLPDGLKVGGFLYLKGCTGLTSLPADLEVGGDLTLTYCTGLTELPSDLVVQGNWIINRGMLTPFFKKLGIPVDEEGDTLASDWREWQEDHGYLKEAFKAGNRARKKEAVQDSQTDNIDTIDNLEDLLDVCDKVVRLYSGREHQFPKGWVFGTDGSGINPPEIAESPVNDRQYLRNWLVKYRYDFNGSRIRNDLAKEIPGDDNHKFDSEWDIIHSNGRATHLNFDYTVGVTKKKDEDGYRIIFNDGINEVCIYMQGYNRSSFGMALMHLFGVSFMKRYIKAAYYQGVNDPLGDKNYKEAVQMVIHLFTEDVPMSVWKPGHVISVEIGQEPVYTNNDFTK